MVFSPHSSGVLYVAANRVFRSTDKGDSWTAISPDLTANKNRNEIVTMGVVGSQIRIAANDGISNWGTIVSLAESPKQAGVYYTGTDDGTVNMSKDEGKTWTNVTTEHARASRRARGCRKSCRRATTRPPSTSPSTRTGSTTTRRTSG